MDASTVLPGWGDLEWLKVADLKPHRRNPRTHTKKQIRQIADSIARFGFTNPVLIDEAGRIIAGHGRVEAAKLLSLEVVPVRRTADLSEADRRAYIIADNRLAELAGWDSELLGLEIGSILEMEPDFDIGVIGFDPAEIEALLSGTDGGELAMHPTVKPVAMVADAIRDCSRRNGIVLDAFSGSGTTIIAAEQTGNRGNMNSLFVVREIIDVGERGLKQWLFAPFEQLARYASWVPQSGGRSMAGGGSSVIRIPKAAFSVLDTNALQQL